MILRSEMHDIVAIIIYHKFFVARCTCSLGPC